MKITKPILLAFSMFCMLLLSSCHYLQKLTLQKETWEYKIVVDDGGVNLNQLGKDGWELVSVSKPSPSCYQGYLQQAGGSIQLTALNQAGDGVKFYFKRPIYK